MAYRHIGIAGRNRSSEGRICEPGERPMGVSPLGGGRVPGRTMMVGPVGASVISFIEPLVLVVQRR
jgi:hypothetical protein